MTHRWITTIASALLSASILTAGTAAVAQQRVLEEVIVTAQLRAESLQDVPVSVNAVAGEKLLEAGLEKLEDLQAYVPNLTMSETGISTNIYIRGIGSGINQGFEQSVGMYFDGVSYGRAQLSRAPFLDLARVEVLRGPQNILFGKNSIAGAVALYSARPGDEFEGRTSLLYEPEHGEGIVDLVLSGPLSDNLGARLALRYREMDGYIENLTLDRDEPSREEITGRLLFDWAVNDRLQTLIKLERGIFDVTGRQVEVVTDQVSTSTNPLFAGKTYAQILDSTPAAGIDADSSVLNNFQDYKRSSNGDYSNNDTYNLTVHADFDHGDNVLTFVTGLMAYEFEEVADVDFTGAEIFDGLLKEKYRQFSQEFRWVSPAGEGFEYIAGGYLHLSRLEYFDAVRIDSEILPALLNLADTAASSGPGSLGDAPADGDVIGGTAGVGDAGDHLRKLRTPRDFTTDTDMLSAFFQGTWQLTDALRGTLGVRASWEDKSGSRDIRFINEAGAQNPPDPQERNTVLAKNLRAEEQTLRGRRISTNIAPSLKLQYDWSDDVMLYTTLSRGFKSGGFDARSNQSPADNDPAPHNPNYGDDFNERFRGSFEFDEEENTTLELGAKTRLAEGAAELNVAAFWTEYDDLQVSIFDGSIGFNVGNAGAARVLGIEMEGRWALTERLTLSGSLAFLDFEFTDFEDGKCFQNQPDPEDDGLCDFTGKTNQYVADFSGAISLQYQWPISDALLLTGVADVLFTDDYNPTQDLDPRMLQDGYAKLNMRLALSHPDGRWEAALIGKNLTDEVIITYANSMSLANSIFGSVGHYAFLEPPRSVALQLNYRWGS